MATSIPTHNLSEVIDGISEMIKQADDIGHEIREQTEQISYGEITINVTTPKFSTEASLEDIMQHIKGPDFPTGGIIYDKEEIKKMYATGKGRVVTRAKVHMEETKKGKSLIVVTELPYQVNKSTLQEKIAELVKSKKVEGIDNINDETDKDGMRIVIEVKKGYSPKKIENKLYKYSQLQNNFNGNLVALVNREPKLLSLKTILEEFIKHRQEVIIRRTIYLLKKVKNREHILQGLKIALDNIDEIIKLIRASADTETAKQGLISRFGLTAIQAQAILDMQLRRLSALERHKIEEELAEIIKTIEDYEDLLASPKRIIETVDQELQEIKEIYGDKRRSKYVPGKVGELQDADIIQEEGCIVTISTSGYIKRLSEETYKAQGRGGKGVKAQILKEEDQIETISHCSTHDWGLFFTDSGKVLKMRIWEIPETSRNSRGTPLINFLSISNEDKIQSFIALNSTHLEKGKGYIFFGTEKGIVKKTEITKFDNIRSSGIIAINLEDEDKVAWVRYTEGNNDIMLISKHGKSIRFSEEDVRPMGRTAKGVIGIKLRKKDDKIIGLSVVNHEEDLSKLELVTISENGYGKKTNLDEFKVQKRGGTGIKAYNTSTKTGGVVSAKVFNSLNKQDVLIVSKNGAIIRINGKTIPTQGRDTMGVKLINLKKDDNVSAVAFLEDE
jgi:DNA gyrase subunit A